VTASDRKQESERDRKGECKNGPSARYIAVTGACHVIRRTHQRRYDSSSALSAVVAFVGDVVVAGVVVSDSESDSNESKPATATIRL